MNLKVYGKNRELWQWDTDQMLIVEGGDECQQVHFSRPGDISCPVVQIREYEGHRVADIPNLYLQQPGKFYAFLCGVSGSAAQTYYREKFVIRERPRPDTYVYIQTQVLRYENLENRVATLEKHSGENNGAVKTVNGIAPDESGNVEIDTLPKDTEQIEMLIEADLLPAVHDASDAILTDENGNIILRY